MPLRLRSSVQPSMAEFDIPLFAYGTLQQEDVQLASFGRLLQGEADALPRYRLVPLTISDPEVVRLSGKAVHTAACRIADSDHVIPGTLFRISAVELAAADDYEVSEMARVEVTLASGKRAFVYVLAAGESRLPPP